MITTKIIFGFLILCSLNAVALAQKGTAPPGFYPPGFNGDTWSGEVTAVDEAKREMTLTHGKDEKAKTFIAYVPDAGMYTSRGPDDTTIVEVGSIDAKPSKSTPSGPPHMKLSALLAHQVTVYYINREKKDANGEKIKFKEVFKLIVSRK